MIDDSIISGWEVEVSGPPGIFRVVKFILHWNLSF